MTQRRLIGQRILITGAGSGLGKALALRFAGQGWQVAATDVRIDAAGQTLEEIRRAGGKGTAAALDVASEAAFAEVVARLHSEWGGLDVLINNAGVATKGTVEEASLEQWQSVLDINVLGCVRGARAVIPLMKAQQGGHIVNIASFAGISNPPALASYNVSKAAVISLSETLRFEVFQDGIGVSVACPSFFRTNLLETSKAMLTGIDATVAPQMDRISERLMETSPVTAEDVARDIEEAVRDNRFLVVSHADARLLHRIKRLSPELYFRLAQKRTAKFLVRPPAAPSG